MKESEKFISDTLKKNMYKIDDDSFTERIVKTHISRQKNPIYKPFLNFGSLIAGISSVIISIGLILLMRTKILSFDYFVYKEQYGLILLIISLIFLISSWIEYSPAQKSKVTGKD
jgi:hypothetical protein